MTARFDERPPHSRIHPPEPTYPDSFAVPKNCNSRNSRFLHHPITVDSVGVFLYSDVNMKTHVKRIYSRSCASVTCSRHNSAAARIISSVSNANLVGLPGQRLPQQPLTGMPALSSCLEPCGKHDHVTALLNARCSQPTCSEANHKVAA
jgi:hypothetical protein